MTQIPDARNFDVTPSIQSGGPGLITVKDGFGNAKILQAVGAGTLLDPFRMVNADNLSETIQGNIPGKTTQFITGNNPNIGTSFVDISDFGGDHAFPTVAETIEILSDNANDTATGDGLRTILITTLSSDFTLQQNVVIMDGTTPVSVPDTHLRYRSIVAFTAGDTGFNEGTIIVRIVGVETTRLQMQPTEGNSFSSLFTVPKGKEFIPTALSFFVQKGEDVIIRPRVRVNIPDASFISSGPAPLYQSTSNVPIVATNVLTTGSDVFFQAKSTNTPVNATVVLEGDLIDV